MPKKKEADKGDIMFDFMPGFEVDGDLATEEIDLNFGLGDEDDDDEDAMAPTADGDDADGDETPDEDEEGEESSEDDEEKEEADPEGEEGKEGDDPEEPGETPESEGKTSKGKEPTVPKSRLDQVLARARKAEAQLEALQSGQLKQDAPDTSEGEEFDFDGKEEEYQNLLLEGETKSATAVRREINAALVAQVTQSTRQNANETTNQARVNEKLLEVAQEIEAEYPEFDPNSDTFDKDMTDEILEIRAGLVATGKPQITALSKAVELVVKAHGLQSLSDQAEAAKTAIRGKKKTTISDKVKAANSQPARMEGKRADTRRDDADLDLSQLNEEEFNALPEATLRKLRGDIF